MPANSSELKLACLISGRGSNLQALIQAISKDELKAKILTVISNKTDAAGLKIAKSLGIHTQAIPSKDNSHFEADLITELNKHNFDYLVLAGFMKILSPQFISQYKNKIINIHPSLLPAFPGLHAHQQALDYGVKLSGCTVHLVDEGCDTGPILAQVQVPLLDDDDEASLAARILIEEHKILAQTLEKIRQKGFIQLGRKLVYNKEKK